jgi:hypothetical protein
VAEVLVDVTLEVSAKTAKTAKKSQLAKTAEAAKTVVSNMAEAGWRVLLQ